MEKLGECLVNMKKIIIYILGILSLISLVMATQTPIFTSPASSGLITSASTYTLTTSGCSVGYKYSIYIGLSSPPNTTILIGDITGTITGTIIGTPSKTTAYYQSSCGNGYSPTNLSGLLAWFPLDNADTSWTLNKTNSSIDTYSAQLNNMTSAENNISGVINQGMFFGINGKKNYVNITIPNLTPYITTVSVWFKAVPTSTNGYILALGNGSNNALGLYLTSAGTLFAYGINSSGTSFSGGSIPITYGAWYNAMLIYTPVPSKVFLYLNGDYISGSGTISGGIAPITEMRIGNEYSATQYNFNGSIDEVLIYNNSFTNNDIKALYLLQNNDSGWSDVGNITYMPVTNSMDFKNLSSLERTLFFVLIFMIIFGGIYTLITGSAVGFITVIIGTGIAAMILKAVMGG